jgi:septal ring factor EnvC (AmiA/AmiB activator)
MPDKNQLREAGITDEVIRAVRQKLTAAEASLTSLNTQIDTTLDKLADAHERRRKTRVQVAELQEWVQRWDPEGKVTSYG